MATTIEQKQCLLKVLGYYEGRVDGIWGRKSEQATREFQDAYGDIDVDGKFGPITEQAARHAVCYGMPEREAPDEPLELTDEAFWASIKHWKREDFKCRCGEYHAPYCDGFPVEPDRKLVLLADQVAEHFGGAVQRSSGIRCEQHNTDSGGVENSRHRFGKALDFRIKGKNAKQTLAFVNTLPGVRYAYDIDGTYVHMDVE